MRNNLIFLFFFSMLILSGCASSSLKERQEQREKMASSTGMYCQFLNGDSVPDLDVELSMEMGRRCDANKNFTITNYKNSAEQFGVIYCCAALPVIEKKKSAITTPATAAPADGKSESVPAPEVSGK